MSDTLERLETAFAGRYAIEREIGSGGMATVYQAEDRKHHRLVAIKVLRPDLAATLGSERFLREIEVAARLQHPHILPLHDSGDADGFLYYVMPFVEGQSLREKLAREGELPIADAVRIIRDVVDALTEAHAHGVVHRDIKPENILLRGRHALVADFGVAKAVSEATGREQLTTAGIALGTPSYMAPEQASADPHLDHRVDIYAVGAVAYELLTGRPVFMGSTPQMILSAHVADPPQPVSKYREAVPATVEAVVMRCLEKKPADRWQSAEALLEQLEALATPSGGITPTQLTPVASRRRSRVRGAAALLAVAVVAAGAGYFGWKAWSTGAPAISIAGIRQVTRAPELELYPALSPDGNDVVYARGSGGSLHLYVQDVGGGRALPLTEDRPGMQIHPHWSEDGRSIAFADVARDGSLAIRRVPRLGGPAQQLLDLGQHPAYHFMPQIWFRYRGDRLAFARRDSLYVRDAGSNDRFVARVPPSLHSLVWSPDGRFLAYVEGNPQFVFPATLGSVGPSTIWTVAAAGGDPVPVTRGSSLDVSPVWTPDGRHILFVSDRAGTRGLWAVRVDDRARPDGEPVPLATALDAHSLSLSADGRTIAFSRFTFRRNIMRVQVPATGSVSITEATPITVGNQIVEGIGVSPDGRWLAFDSNLGGDQNIYVMPANGGEPRQLTTHPAGDYAPDYSPDGREIAFHSTRFGSRDIFTMSADGGTITRLTDEPGEEYMPQFSPDGRHIVYFGVTGEAVGLYLLAREAPGEPWGEPQFLAPAGSAPHWSPDGRRIAYRLEGGLGGLAVITRDGLEQQTLDLPPGLLCEWINGWSADGRSILFMGSRQSGYREIYRIDADGGPVRPLVLFDDPTRALWLARPGPDNVLFMSVAEYESDIYVADVESGSP